MAQRDGFGGFFEEIAHSLLIADGQVGPQYLDCDSGFRDFVLRAIDHPHSTDSNQFLYLVTFEGGAYEFVWITFHLRVHNRLLVTPLFVSCRLTAERSTSQPRPARFRSCFAVDDRSLLKPEVHSQKSHLRSRLLCKNRAFPARSGNASWRSSVCGR